MKKIHLFQIITFLSSFLLFQIELIIGKIFLPNFGGSYLVWGACVVFFQAALLLGYMYAHYILQIIEIKIYRIIHFIILFIPFFFFPGHSLALQFSRLPVPMVLDVFLKLIITIGPVFFILSTMSLITQSWLALSTLKEKDNPYVLFAVSNLGSFLALFSYPFYFELTFDLSTQQLIWKVLYFILIGLFLITAYLIKPVSSTCSSPQKVNDRHGDIKRQDILTWLLYGAAGSVMFIAVTNIITSKIMPMPLLWILPLAIYLISFTFIFQKNTWCPKFITDKFHITIGMSLLLYFLIQKKIFPDIIQLILLLISLFIICMFCQAQLYTSRPKKLQNLTLFYLIISLGSFLGGLVVTWFIPVIFSTYIEYLLGLSIVAWAWKLGEKKKTIEYRNFMLTIFLLIVVYVWPVIFIGYSLTGLIIIMALFYYLFSELRKNRHGLTFCLLIILLLSQHLEPFWTNTKHIFKHRNYYGTIKVYDEEGIRTFVHSKTVHGKQFVNEHKRNIPLAYFFNDSPIGKILSSKNFKFKNIGILGLGVGTMAAYFDQTQNIDFFEIDPDVLYVADQYFSFLNSSPASINHHIGDGRLMISQIPENQYDLIIVDVFSGDNIPVHLVTYEAIQQYKRQLKTEGMIIFHISNRYVDARDVLFKIAQSLNAHSCYKDIFVKENPAIYSSQWLTITWDENKYHRLLTDFAWQADYAPVPSRARMWTDQYTCILPYFDKKQIFQNLKKFKFFSL
ncbi:MAG: fused MFS/spermidine synthase [Candidatus Omnitrophica bacterium]|nr:fused MFS/spermidine synthase [Candidatus Omnitrophota bacterium]